MVALPLGKRNPVILWVGSWMVIRDGLVVWRKKKSLVRTADRAACILVNIGIEHDLIVLYSCSTKADVYLYCVEVKC